MIGDDGHKYGEIGTDEARAVAEEKGFDLVEVSPDNKPPVAKLMDYGKFKYREAKKAHEAKLKQKQIQVKEVKFRPSTDEGDYKIKLRNLVKFLEEGDKTKVTLRYRGREMAHQEFGHRLIERVRKDLEPYATVEQFPKMEGRQLIMVLAPKKGKKEVKPVKKDDVKKDDVKKEAVKKDPKETKPVASH